MDPWKSMRAQFQLAEGLTYLNHAAVSPLPAPCRKRMEAYIEELSKSERFRGRKIVTTVERAGSFHEAEAYHQDYHAKHGGSCSLPRGSPWSLGWAAVEVATVARLSPGSGRGCAMPASRPLLIVASFPAIPAGS